MPQGTVRCLARLLDPVQREERETDNIPVQMLRTIAPWFGLFAPKGTPDSVIAAIEQAMTNAMSEPEFRAKLVAIGLELDQPGTSGQFADFVAAEIPRMAEILRSARMLQQP